MKKAAFLVMIITIFSKFLGFGREIILSYVYGASAITDAYLISKTIPTAIFSFISAGIATAFIPLYSRILNERGRLEANNYTSNLSNALLLLSSIIVVLVLLFTQPIVKLFASGFSGETLTLAINFTRISVFGVYFTALFNIYKGFLRIHDRYIIPALAAFPMNLVVIASLLISTKTNIYIIAIGSVLATASQLLLLIPYILRTGYKYHPILNLKDENIRMMIIIALPVIVGTSVNEINVLVDRTLASGIAVGGISALNYAGRLKDFVQGLFVASITTVMYPMISKMAAEKNIEGLKKYVSEAISIINFLIIPATIGAMIFSSEIVNLLFGRGAFTSDATIMTGNALFYYSIGMIAFGLRDVLSRAFYALQDTKTPMINATIAVIINIILNIILSRYLGIGGLALATSISAILGTVLLFMALRKKIGGFGLREISKSFIKISLASIVMGLIALASFNYSKHYFRENVSLIIAIGIGVIVYGVLVYFMRIPEVDQTVELIKSKTKGKVGKKGE
ncbi:MAG: murein biosynthesis integral membrane protein MurJ [Bacteroidales bacterium]|nr:murein biosynthesis integral membrane protein MurJ [Bacteroidales bacterium]